jgi:hypothetical protein
MEKGLSARPGMETGVERKSILGHPLVLERDMSSYTPATESTTTTVIKRTVVTTTNPRTGKKETKVVTGEGDRFQYSKGRRRFIPKIEHTPPKSLVMIWVVVMSEMILDLVTTIISFVALVNEADCCDETIQLGIIPLTTTIPFFLLIVAEVGFMAQAIKLTMCPRNQEVQNKYENEPDERMCLTRWFCCCLRWNARMIFRFISFLVMLNPFFGAVVAWMLLYQSSKKECFTVLGLEGASLFLHFLSIYLEGEKQNFCSIAFHLIPVVPFLASVILILVYLQQGGVCYLVKDTKFWYDGCRVCANGLPPKDLACWEEVIKWNNYTDPRTGEYFTIQNKTFDWVPLSRNPLGIEQVTYCGEAIEDQFCFFTY